MSYLKTVFFYVFVSLSVCIRFLIGNLYGIVITLMIVRYFSESLFGYPAYSFQELLVWGWGLSDEMKIAISSSLVTVIGFLVAYASATSNWKSQLLANIKLQAWGELNSFFTEVNSIISALDVYASQSLEASNKLRTSKNHQEKLSLVSYLNSRSYEIDAKQKRLVALSIQVHDFTGKYANLFISVPLVKSNFDVAARALGDITSRTWFTVPHAYPEDTDPVTTYLIQIDEDKMKQFRDIVEQKRALITFYPGSAGGVLQSGVVPINAFSLLNLFKGVKVVHYSFEEIRKAKKAPKIEGSN